MINATKETYRLLTRNLTFVSYCQLFNGCQFQKCADNLGHILSLCRHFLVNEHDKEASNDQEARKQ